MKQAIYPSTPRVQDFGPAAGGVSRRVSFSVFDRVSNAILPTIRRQVTDDLNGYRWARSLPGF
jgi:hypothetical protein